MRTGGRARRRGTRQRRPLMQTGGSERRTGKENHYKQLTFLSQEIDAADRLLDL